MVDCPFPELGFYIVPGHILDPVAAYEEIAAGERLGLGSVWISERLNSKNVEVMSGLVAARTDHMGIASGLMANMPLRHPLVTAGYASTMMKLTNNRFSLGVGRGHNYLADPAGIPRSTFRVMEDYIAVVRQLWRGEDVTYSGPLGTYRELRLGTKLDSLPPIIMAAMGDKTAYWAGQFADGVHLTSLWGPRAVRNSVKHIRQGAIDAGRNPDDVKVWVNLVIACDVPEEVGLTTVIRRMNTYLLAREILGQRIEQNGWNPSDADMLCAELKKLDTGPSKGMHLDEHTTRDLDHLRHMRDLYPADWMESVALGTADECAAKIRGLFDAGADGVILIGAPPSTFASLIDIWPNYRPTDRFKGRPVNPGLTLRP